MKITPIQPSWGVKIEFDSPSDFFNQDIKYWRSLMYNKSLLLFKHMHFSDSDYAKFCATFGNMWKTADYDYSKEATQEIEVDGVIMILAPMSNKISPVNAPRLKSQPLPWHADIPHRFVNPFPMRSLWMVNNPDPTTGLTGWMNIELDLAILPDRLKDLISKLRVIQQSWLRPGTEFKEFDFIKTHPVTGRKSMRLNYFNDAKVGIKNGYIHSLKLDGKIIDPGDIYRDFFAVLEKQKNLQYVHQWDDRDIVIYDNWTFVHNRTALSFSDASGLERVFLRCNIDHVF